jgi:hypothetical protein
MNQLARQLQLYAKCEWRDVSSASFTRCFVALVSSCHKTSPLPPLLLCRLTVLHTLAAHEAKAVPHGMLQFPSSYFLITSHQRPLMKCFRFLLYLSSMHQTKQYYTKSGASATRNK